MKDFKQTPENLLHEIDQALYKYVLTEDKCEKLRGQKDDRIAHDNYMLHMLLMIAARIIRDLRTSGGENIPDILEKYSERGISLFNCNVSEHLEEIMPPP